MHGWFWQICFGKESNSSRRVILKIKLELNNLNSILSRSAVTPVFPVAEGSDASRKYVARVGLKLEVAFAVGV